MLPKPIFFSLYNSFLELPISEYIYDDYDRDLDDHCWPDWFHNLLILMRVPPEIYTISYDMELTESNEDRLSTYYTESEDPDSRYLWYTILYELGYRTPSTLLFKEL